MTDFDFYVERQNATNFLFLFLSRMSRKWFTLHKKTHEFIPGYVLGGVWRRYLHMFSKMSRLILTNKDRRIFKIILILYKKVRKKIWPAVFRTFHYCRSNLYIYIYICVCVCVYLGSISSLIHIWLYFIDIFCLHIFLLILSSCCISLWYCFPNTFCPV